MATTVNPKITSAERETGNTSMICHFKVEPAKCNCAYDAFSAEKSRLTPSGAERLSRPVQICDPFSHFHLFSVLSCPARRVRSSASGSCSGFGMWVTKKSSSASIDR